MSTEMNEQEQHVLAEFERLGKEASFHFAAESSGDWRNGYPKQQQAMKIYWAWPKLQPQMDKIGVGFLWSLEMQVEKGENEWIDTMIDSAGC